MHTERLLHLADYLAVLPDEQFELGEAVVVSGHPLVGCSGLADVLPQGSKAGPVGWLPGSNPEAWCWVIQGGAVLPVYKSSALWMPERYDFAEFRSSTWQMDLRFWRQVGEWFEIQDPGMLDSLFSWKTYVTPRKSDVVSRLQAAALQ